MFNHCRGVSGLLIELLAVISAFFFLLSFVLPYHGSLILWTELASHHGPLVLDFSKCNFTAFTGASSFKELKLEDTTVRNFLDGSITPQEEDASQ